jgi:hypothetical protein
MASSKRPSPGEKKAWNEDLKDIGAVSDVPRAGVSQRIEELNRANRRGKLNLRTGIA